MNNAKRTIIVENNYSGQFARYLRSETGLAADGHIRKYDGEPFMPHHIVEWGKGAACREDGPLCAGSGIYSIGEDCRWQ